MSEQTVLEISLWVFTAGFANKGLTFLRLALVMRHQRDKSRLGKALLWHYTALASQALALAFIFFYYATRYHSGDDWLDPRYRITMYIIGTAFVIWASIMGNRLTLAYTDATHVSIEDVEQEPTNEPTNARQDIREVSQNDHEALQLEIEQRQSVTKNIQDAREILQGAEWRRQVAQGQALDDRGVTQDTREGLANMRQSEADTREGLADVRQDAQDTRDTDREEVVRQETEDARQQTEGARQQTETAKHTTEGQ